MKFIKYLQDKIYAFVLFIFMYFILLMLLIAFKQPRSLIIAISILLFFFSSLMFFIDYFRKKSFYNQLLTNIQNLEKSYLVLETIKPPAFYEGELLTQALYDINKSMIENVKKHENLMTDFKEYIELWIHEVKIPISSLTLMAHNHQDKFDKKFLEQLRKLEAYVDQVLYYVRSEYASVDYLIKENDLDKIISLVALKNKDDLLAHHINLVVENTHYQVFSDAKWLEFIINQIINNSIKYKKDQDSYIKIKAQEEKDKILLMIEDNGIGIPKEDLPKVFEKTFTGYNGRIKTKSTGMGLFIAKNLCSKLNHQIMIESQVGEYTRVTILFFKNKYYDVLK